jgi:hypothetical protein
MGQMAGAATFPNRGMNIRPVKCSLFVTGVTQLIGFRGKQSGIIAVVHRMACTATPFGKRLMNGFFLSLSGQLLMTRRT